MGTKNTLGDIRNIMIAQMEKIASADDDIDSNPDLTDEQKKLKKEDLYKQSDLISGLGRSIVDSAKAEALVLVSVMKHSKGHFVPENRFFALDPSKEVKQD